MPYSPCATAEIRFVLPRLSRRADLTCLTLSWLFMLRHRKTAKPYYTEAGALVARVVKGVSALIVPHDSRSRTERLLASANITAEWATPPSAEEVLKRDNERLLADTEFSELISVKEREVVSALLEVHSAESIAAAFVRQYRATTQHQKNYYSLPTLLTPAIQKAGIDLLGAKAANKKPNRGGFCQCCASPTV